MLRNYLINIFKIKFLLNKNRAKKDNTIKTLLRSKVKLIEEKKLSIIWDTLYIQRTSCKKRVILENLFKSPFVHSAERRNNYRTF